MGNSPTKVNKRGEKSLWCKSEKRVGIQEKRHAMWKKQGKEMCQISPGKFNGREGNAPNTQLGRKKLSLRDSMNRSGKGTWYQDLLGQGLA